MNLFGKPPGKKYHTRNIEVSTYEYDENRLAVEGCLTDQRMQEYYLASGEKKEPGIMHHMIIHLLVKKANLEIEDLHVEMPCIPRPECLETINSLDQVRGLRIAGGFTLKVKALVGRGQGCSHLVALLTAMGSAAVQGYAAYKLQEPAGFSADMVGMLEDTCWAWRAEGDLMKAFKEKIKAPRHK